jgi:hypothetical protein
MVVLYGGKIRAEGTADELLCDTERTVIQSPRLSVDTISRIDAVINEREGKAIEKVHAPRQRLESLFMEIVEKARIEQVETSGAQSGGATAEFLRADSEAEGDDLIDTLSQAEVPVELSTEIDEQPEMPKEPDVLEDLMDEQPPQQVTEVVEKEPTAKADDNINRGLIDELMGSNDAEDRDS